MNEGKNAIGILNLKSLKINRIFLLRTKNEQKRCLKEWLKLMASKL